MTRRIAFPAGGLALTLILAACSGTAAPSAPSTAAANVPSDAPASQAPTEAPPSQAPSASASSASSEAPSLALPSFVLPSDDKGLEALLPDEMCGKKAIKTSASGTRYKEYETDTDKALLAQLDKTIDDIVFAFAGPGVGAGGCRDSALIYRVKGADPDRLKAVFIAAAKQEADTTYTTGNIGGRDVYIGTTPGANVKSYAYFNGDALFQVTAQDDASAAKVLKGMP